LIYKRFLFLVVLFFAAFIVLVAKLADLQLRHHDYFVAKTIDLTEKVEIKKPIRGEIYDRNKILLASSIQLFRLYFDKSMIDEEKYDTALSFLSSVTKQSKKYYLYKVQSTKSKIVYLEDSLLTEEYLKLKDTFFINKISCFGFEEYHKRIYPKEGIAAHILGYVRKDSEGVDGVEKAYNYYLKGSEGVVYYRKDASGRIQGRIRDKGFDAKDGYNLQLTIDLEIQNILEEELGRGVSETKANYGIGIIMNPNTGEIIALANKPSFNPARYFEYSDYERKNKAISDLYDPGSTFKAVTLASAIELGKVDLDKPMFAENGYYQLPNGKVIRDDHKFSYLTPKEAFIYSSNVMMAKISRLIGERNFYKYVFNFGFGNYTGIDLPGEVKGIVVKPKEEGYNLLWMAHGYSISVTPIQLVTMYAAIINGGNLVKPFVVKKIFDNQGNVIEENNPIIIRKVISNETSKIMRQIMALVVTEGTGKKAKLELVSCGGKTGTAKKFIQGVGYSTKDYVSSFVGFFPVESPEYLIFIKLDSPKNGYYGGEVAAPIFKRIGDRIWNIKQAIQNQEPVLNEIKVVSNDLKQFPDLTGKSRVSAIEIAKSLGVKIEILGNGEIVHNQVYDHYKNKVTLILDEDGNVHQLKTKVQVPNLIGLSIREASTKLKSSGIQFTVEGTGYVVDQSIPPGMSVDQNTKLKLICQRGI
jgi:cell division protein FtsI/penicillin-binding protein 2